MAKRTNRVAWGLVVVLSTALLAGITVLCSPYVVVLPRQEWGFGQRLFASHSPRPKVNPFRIGFFGVRVK
jgi:hypothetical protein